MCQTKTIALLQFSHCSLVSAMWLKLVNVNKKRERIVCRKSNSFLRLSRIWRGWLRRKKNYENKSSRASTAKVEKCRISSTLIARLIDQQLIRIDRKLESIFNSFQSINECKWAGQVQETRTNWRNCKFFHSLDFFWCFFVVSRYLRLTILVSPIPTILTTQDWGRRTLRLIRLKNSPSTILRALSAEKKEIKNAIRWWVKLRFFLNLELDRVTEIVKISEMFPSSSSFVSARKSCPQRLDSQEMMFTQLITFSLVAKYWLTLLYFDEQTTWTANKIRWWPRKIVKLNKFLSY